MALPRTWILSVFGLTVLGLANSWANRLEAPDRLARREELQRMFRSEDWQGKHAPDFRRAALDASSFQLADEVGHRVVVLNFFATWCGPCREETPELLRLAERYRGRDFALVGVVGDEPQAKIDEYVHELGITFRVIRDESENIQRSYGVTSIPTTVVVGADGRIALYETGAIRNGEVALSPAIDAELAKIAAGKGIGREAFLEADRHAQESARTRAMTGAGQGSLPPHAREVAAKMACVCGCDQKVLECGCGTAKKILAELATTDFSKQSDEAVVSALDRKYCLRSQLQ